MPPQIKFSIFLFLILFIFSSSVRVEGFEDGTKFETLVHEVTIQLMIPRKLMGVNTVMDYEYAGPNPKHDPIKGKPIGGDAKNP